MQTFPLVSISNNRAITTSLGIAERFNKLHKDVLRSIKNLIGQLPHEWYKRNFALIQNSVDLGFGRSRKDPAYEISRDGFALLAMGFTGAEALKFKIDYIDAFNAMEAEIQRIMTNSSRFKQWTHGMSEIYEVDCEEGRIRANQAINFLKYNKQLAGGSLLSELISEMDKCGALSTHGVRVGFLAQIERFIAGK